MKVPCLFDLSFHPTSFECGLLCLSPTSTDFDNTSNHPAAWVSPDKMPKKGYLQSHILKRRATKWQHLTHIGLDVIPFTLNYFLLIIPPVALGQTQPFFFVGSHKTANHRWLEGKRPEHLLVSFLLQERREQNTASHALLPLLLDGTAHHTPSL